MFEKYFSKKKLVCFDFDGLLVNTEPLHHLAYQETLAAENAPLDLDFSSYCKIAHSADRDLFKKTVKTIHPSFSTDWQSIREAKAVIYRRLLKDGLVTPMDGAEELLELLQNANISVCIVTNSDRCDVEEIAKNLPFLQKIPRWITREDYASPKPSPDGYLKALKDHDTEQEFAIGLEDTHKGISAIKKAGLFPLLINSSLEQEDEHSLLSLKKLLLNK